MNIEQIQANLRLLENKQWPDHIIDSVWCEVWEDGGRWIIEARAKPEKGLTKTELFLSVIAEPSRYKFPWPLHEAEPESSEDTEAAFYRALNHQPSHSEV